MKTQKNKDADLLAVKRYYASLGFNESAINKLVNRCVVRDIDLIQIRIDDYKELFHDNREEVLKGISKSPDLLEAETKGKNIPTSIENKIKNLQTILHLDEAAVIKIIRRNPKITGYDTVNESSIEEIRNRLFNHSNQDKITTIKDKIKALQILLQTDVKNIAQLICKEPTLITLDIKQNIMSSMKFYRDALRLDQSTVIQMIMKYPSILNLDISESPTSVKSKIEKMHEIMPFRELRAIIIDNPKILNTPARSIKIRYMLAMLIDAYAYENNHSQRKHSTVDRFLTKDFLVSEDTVWARLCYLKSKKSNFISHIYRSKNDFYQKTGVETLDLIQQFPLNDNALNQIENDYLKLTHRLFRLNRQELDRMHLKRNAVGMVIHEDTLNL